MKESHNEILITWLIQHGTPINKQNYFGLSPLMVAAYANNLYLVKVLLENGADPNLIAKNGLTALEFARKAGNFYIFLKHWFSNILFVPFDENDEKFCWSCF